MANFTTSADPRVLEQERQRLAGAAIAPQNLSPQITGQALLPVSTPTLAPSTIPPIPAVSAIPLAEAPAPQPDDFTSQLSSLTTRLEGRGAEEERRIGEASIESERQLSEINKQIKMLQAEELKATTEAEQRGETLGFAAGEAARVRRNFAVEAIRLSALSEAIQGNVVFAQRQAKSAVDTEFAQIQADAQTARRNILENYDSFTAAEKKRADAALLRLDERDQFVAEQKAARLQSQNLAIQVGATGKATNAQLQAIANADPITASNLAAPFLQEPSKRATQVIDINGRKVLIDTQTGATITDFGGGAGIGGAEVTAPYGTNEYWEQLIGGSKGGKDLTGDQTAPLTKASIVLNQVGELASQISSAETGPVLGILRDNNPYDVKARLIQAQLRATVPNLARGVYGEVGVLTDTDIANYIQTLPNLRTPEAANKLILSMTLKTIQNSFRSYLETFANSGRDVSGFLKQYQAIGEKIQSIEKEIGISTEKGELPHSGEEEAIFDSVVGNQSQSYWGRLWNSLMGR